MDNFYVDLGELTALRAAARRDARSPETLRRVAGEFEALFLQMVLKGMRAAHLAEDAFASDAQRHYLEWFDAQLALHLARGQGLGIARLLIERLEQSAAAQNTKPADRHGQTVTQERGGKITAPGRHHTAADDLGQSPEHFVRTLWPHARRAAAALAVTPQALIAQAALETGWGKSVLRHPDGRPSYNVFAIKAGPDWAGARVRVATLEYENGVAVRRSADFRAYASYEEAFADYVRLLTSTPRYRAALGQAGTEAFAGALQEAGYATDPAYARKIAAIARSDTLGAVLAALKSGAEGPLT